MDEFDIKGVPIATKILNFAPFREINFGALHNCTIAERVQIVQFYYENNRNIAYALRKIRAFFPRHKIQNSIQ